MRLWWKELWCRLLGHFWSWPLAYSWGYTHAPMCEECGHVPLDQDPRT